jgi:hypothetical protein
MTLDTSYICIDYRSDSWDSENVPERRREKANEEQQMTKEMQQVTKPPQSAESVAGLTQPLEIMTVGEVAVYLKTKPS